MTTYICKCGRTFQKSTEAGTTGFRMPDYGPAHECYGCPFVQKECWRENGKDVDAFACRGSKVLDYQTDAYCCGSLGAALHVRTLDLEFIQKFFKEYLALPGHLYEYLYHGMDSAENGKWQYSLGFAANRQGEADRNALIDRYFRSEGGAAWALPSGCDRLVRKDITPEQEKEIVLNKIKEAKAVAQGMEAPVETGVKYYHNGLAYFTGKREDNGKYTVFLDDADNPGPDTLTEAATVPDFDTFEEAQNALDGLALKRGFSTECSTQGEKPEMEQQEYYSLGADPDGGPVVSLPNDAEQKDASADQSGPSTDENPPSDNDAGDSANDTTEQPPQSCDWKNASGADEKEDEAEGENDEVSGDPLSLRGSEFDAIMSAADSVLNRLVAMLHEKKQRDGEMTIKVTFEDADGMGAFVFGGAVSGKINYTVKPQKIVGDALNLQFDAQGNPIVPADREHQLNFEKIQAGQREYPPSGGTAKVDGKTGIVEDYQEDGEKPGDTPTSEDTTNPVVGGDSDPGEGSDELYPCKNSDCPFYVIDPEDPDASGCDFSDPDSEDVAEAVEVYGCTRPEVLQAYSEDHPVENESEENSNE